MKLLSVIIISYYNNWRSVRQTDVTAKNTIVIVPYKILALIVFEGYIILPFRP